jgi:RecJ-like exonuclease
MKPSRNTITVPVYTNRDQIDATFPARWIVCPACDGRATTTRHIECDGGGFTASEWAEACGDDEDFAEDYFSGRYDRECPTCKGRSTIQVIDEEAVTGWRERILLKAYYEQERDSREIDAIQAAERRMGA